MKIPASGKPRALIIVDVQETFLKPRNAYVIENITKIVEKVSYDLYVDATFDIAGNPLWHEQEGWSMPESDTNTADMIATALKTKPHLSIQKKHPLGV